jgi:hypothetical protein
MLSSAATKPPVYEALRVLQQGSLVAIQPCPLGAASTHDTLSIDLSSGRIQHSVQPTLGKGAQEALAVIGVFKLKAGTVVALVTGAEQVGPPTSLAGMRRRAARRRSKVDCSPPGIMHPAHCCRHPHLAVCAGGGGVRAAHPARDEHQSDQAPWSKV